MIDVFVVAACIALIAGVAILAVGYAFDRLYKAKPRCSGDCEQGRRCTCKGGV